MRESFHESLGEVSIVGETVTFEVVSDDRPEIALAHDLWRDVYTDELAYDTGPGGAATRASRNGSLCILACSRGRCISTLRMTYPESSPPEFEHAFTAPLGERRCGVLSRLVVRPEVRQSLLSLHLLAACFDFNARSGNAERYDAIVMCCVPALLHFYYLFGFKKLFTETVRSPTIGAEVFLVWCDRADNARAVGEIKRVLRGDRWTKPQWAARLYRCKLEALVDRARLVAHRASRPAVA